MDTIIVSYITYINNKPEPFSQEKSQKTRKDRHILRGPRSTVSEKKNTESVAVWVRSDLKYK